MPTVPVDASLDATERLQAYERALFEASFEAFVRVFRLDDVKEIPPGVFPGFKRAEAKEITIPGFRRRAQETLPKPLERTPERVVDSEEEPRRDKLRPSPWGDLRRRLRTLSPVLYAQVLEPTLADLREEHSAAFANGRPLKAQCVLLQGCGALAAAVVCQLGFSLLDRIAALWQARSPK